MFRFFICYTLTSASVMCAAEAPIRPVTTELPNVIEPSTRVVSELQALDHLIAVTQQNLQNQKKLRPVVEQYLSVRDRFLKNMDDNQLAIRMVALGSQLAEQIKNQHLSHVFDQEFISELNVCEQISQKK